MDQANAKNYCKSLDSRAHLVEIRNQDIQNLVTSLSDLPSDNGYWWIGGTDEQKVNVF